MMPRYDQGGFTPPSSASRRQRNAMLSETASMVPDAAPVAVPIDASTSETTVMIRMFLLQGLPALGLLLSVLGFSETSRIVQVTRFLNSEPAIPIVTAIATLLALAYGLIRTVKRQRKLQTLALLPTTPDSVAIGPTNPSAAVVLAVQAASTVIDQQGAGQPAIDPTTGR